MVQKIPRAAEQLGLGVTTSELMLYNLWATATEPTHATTEAAHLQPALQQGKPLQWEAHRPQQRVAQAQKEPLQPKAYEYIFFKKLVFQGILQYYKLQLNDDYCHK